MRYVGCDREKEDVTVTVDSKQTPYRKLADAYMRERLGIPLDDWIADRLDEGLSPARIADRLAEVTDGIVDVTYRTIYRWTE